MGTGKKVDWLFMFLFAIAFTSGGVAIGGVYWLIWDWTDEVLKKELTAVYTAIVVFTIMSIREKVNKNI